MLAPSRVTALALASAALAALAAAVFTPGGSEPKRHSLTVDGIVLTVERYAPGTTPEPTSLAGAHRAALRHLAALPVQSGAAGDLDDVSAFYRAEGRFPEFDPGCGLEAFCEVRGPDYVGRATLEGAGYLMIGFNPAGQASQDPTRPLERISVSHITGEGVFVFAVVQDFRRAVSAAERNRLVGAVHADLKP